MPHPATQPSCPHMPAHLSHHIALLPQQLAALLPQLALVTRRRQGSHLQNARRTRFNQLAANCVLHARLHRNTPPTCFSSAAQPPAAACPGNSSTPCCSSVPGNKETNKHDRQVVQATNKHDR